MQVAAISWFDASGHPTPTKGICPEGTTEFLMYEDMNRLWEYGTPPLEREEARKKIGEDAFGMWSFFRLQNGDKLIDRILQFEEQTANPTKQLVFDSNTGAWEEATGVYEKGIQTVKSHEIRLVYTAFHLMAQKLAMVVQHPHDRHTRKRFEKERLNWNPWIRLVTLRRLEQHRKEAQERGEVDWHWQWQVRGHWRDQWYPSEQAHKKIFIEAYIKGPENKSLKPPTHTIFKAIR